MVQDMVILVNAVYALEKNVASAAVAACSRKANQIKLMRVV